MRGLHPAAFIKIVIVKECQDIDAVPQARVRFILLQPSSGPGVVIAPAGFGGIFVPNQNLLLIGPVALPEAPFKNFLIRPALGSPFPHVRIIDLEETADPPIKTLADHGKIVGRQTTRPDEAHLVKHAGEVDKAKGGVVGRTGEGHGKKEGNRQLAEGR